MMSIRTILVLSWLCCLSIWMVACNKEAPDSSEAAGTRLAATAVSLATENAILAAENAQLATSPPTSTIPATPSATSPAPTETATTVPPNVTSLPPTATSPPPAPTNPSPPTATSPPPATATPLPAATATPGSPTITQFEIAEVSELPDNGKKVTLAWTVTDLPAGAEVRIFAGTQQRFQPWWTVAPSGTMMVELHNTIHPDPPLMLDAYDTATYEQLVFQEITLPWACQLNFFFEPQPAPCPQEEAITTGAAIQRFENGRMLWLEQTNQIYVLYGTGNEGQFERRNDAWTPGDPESDPALQPPEGLLQPARGFGLVWREWPGVQERLGWALAPEEAFTATLQAAMSEPRVGAGEVYIQMQDGRVIQIIGYYVGAGTWQVVAP